MDRFSIYISYFSGAKIKLLVSGSLIVAQTASLVPIAIILRHIFETSLPTKNSTDLVVSLALILALFFINALATIGNRHLVLSLVKSTTYRIRTDAIAHLAKASRSFYGSSDLDALHTNVVHDSERIDFMTNALFSQFIPGALIVAGLSLYLVAINPLLFVVVSLLLPLGYVAGKSLGKEVQHRTRVFHADFANFSKSVFFFLRFSDLIKISSAEDFERARQENVIANLRDSSKHMSWLSTVYLMMQNNLLVFVGILILLLGGFQVIEGVVTLGSILSFYVALNLLSAQARGAIGAMPVILEGMESLKTVSPLLSVIPVAVSKQPLQGALSKIEFANVAFAHPGASGLMNISFTLTPGKSVGIVGPSGSGKSTIVHLLLGLHEPDAGTVLVNGSDLRTIDEQSYRSHIGVLMQDPALFAGTVRENLLYGTAQCTDEEMERVCRLCEIHESIVALPQGYDTMLGERGVTISGGQRQRIAIARAHLRKPKLLVLDEPNNNLADDMIVRIMQSAMAEGVMLLVITHSEHLTTYLDQVYICAVGAQAQSTLTERT
ncbi:ABC transporter ATP-binding protein/permease [Candidatus Kaiserbacteria bacterium]|nr:ABC transporter ATP-binding protein/permease [Candidatus Kaiserbacteria bacterium]